MVPNEGFIHAVQLLEEHVVVRPFLTHEVRYLVDMADVFEAISRQIILVSPLDLELFKILVHFS